jgi:hypothetical protein
MFTKGPIGTWRSGSKIKELGYRRKERPLETYGPPRVSPLLIDRSNLPSHADIRDDHPYSPRLLSKQTGYNERPMIHPRFDVHVAVFMELAPTVALQRRYLPE